ncbi:hypothetical protein JQS43_05350 [Natronosporangium hydrolyticum]|uniref:CBM6 domain-containing protein n=1 Tax=Natronosporangium hydrolyticum TaxID=2811111 RepID=A0A895YM54_9ACTN|nr:hypothetical protein [Natronosporangium hydrolyticum]QSB15766.1 hypothetical protein JQS43_05350 [Natronosporangium hydrolyticum]
MGDERHSHGRSRRGTSVAAPVRGYRGHRRVPGRWCGYRRLALPALAAGAVLVGGGAFAATVPSERFAPAAPAGRAAPEAVEATAGGPVPVPPSPPQPATGAPPPEPTASPSTVPSAAVESSPTSEAPASPARSPVVRNYEAEHAELSGFVQIFPLPDASGGAVVGSIGRHRDSHVRFLDIRVEDPGEYELTIYYVAPQDRSAAVTVNGDEPIIVEFPGLATGREVGEVSLLITLTAGANEVQIGNPAGLAPSLDRITITG